MCVCVFCACECVRVCVSVSVSVCVSVLMQTHSSSKSSSHFTCNSRFRVSVTLTIVSSKKLDRFSNKQLFYFYFHNYSVFQYSCHQKSVWWNWTPCVRSIAIWQLSELSTYDVHSVGHVRQGVTRENIVRLSSTLYFGQICEETSSDL